MFIVCDVVMYVGGEVWVLDEGIGIACRGVRVFVPGGERSDPIGWKVGRLISVEGRVGLDRSLVTAGYRILWAA